MIEPLSILEELYTIALTLVEENKLENTETEIKNAINPFINKIETDKSLIQLFVTTLLKKIISPLELS